MEAAKYFAASGRGQAAVLVVGGWFDAEDLSGTLKTFHAIDKTSPGLDLHLVMGPWVHGGWQSGRGDKLGDISFNTDTALFFRDQLELPFFRHYLKDAPDAKLSKAVVFETGKIAVSLFLPGRRRMPSPPGFIFMTRAF